MSVLSGVLRKLLERAVVDGRVVAEGGAAVALTRLGVGLRDAPGHLSLEERALRNGLRARARQLGDRLELSGDPGDVWVASPLLVGEVAYEQWHRFLFARFLEVNALLRHPEFGVPVSLEDCQELAAGLGEPDGWSVAARFAAEILPGIFKPSDPAVKVGLAREDLLALERAVTALPAEVFTAEDSLGWVYQFWQSKAKEAVNTSGRKIGGADLSPVTQLFTEDYMVRFLLENSLGAWWAGRYPESPLLSAFDFLRFAEDGTPAAGTFEGWPETVAEVTVMDPCCGSGHFLVGAFGMLWRMRAEEEGLSPAAAQDAVLAENLFGLELDPRCTQIAMFALALEAWKQGGFRKLPVPQVACSGIPAKAPLADWTKLAEGDYQLEAALTRLHTLFADADTLGSLIDPVRASEQAGLESVEWADIAPLLDKALTSEAASSGDPATEVFGEAAAGIARAADYLSRKYTLVATNPPYLVRQSQNEPLRAHCATNFPDSKEDLATTMLERINNMLQVRGSSVAVSPQNWLFLGTFEKFRKLLLGGVKWNFDARLGEGAFGGISGHVVKVHLSGWTTERPGGDAIFSTIDCSTFRGPEAKSEALKGKLEPVMQVSQLNNPQSRITFRDTSSMPLLGDYGVSLKGITSGDDPRWRREMWEVDLKDGQWTFLQGTTSFGPPYSGRQSVMSKRLTVVPTPPGSYIRGHESWGRSGVAINLMNSLNVAPYQGDKFDTNVAVFLPGRDEDLGAVWAFLSSADFSREVRAIDPKLSIQPGTIPNVPFDVDYWRGVAAVEFPEGLPEPFSDDATQWLFRGVPAGAQQPLQVAVARLLGFSWPDQEPDSVDALVDGDGIVCLPAVSGEQSAAERVRSVLAASHGGQWSNARLDELLVEAGGKPGDLAGWLADVFFKDHCKVFSNRPFIWHVWDGRRDGFSALVNYHKLDRTTLEKLTYRSLGWWIDRQRADAAAGAAGAEARLVAAMTLQEKLKLILAGEPPYDIYVRWKSLAEQPVGWDPDLNDGVRLNIRPFVEAGVLRSKFTVHWKKDRGTNPDGTERHNDLHLTNEEKRKARGLS
ncbi:DNA methyltransferase [Pseudarthrobacter sp. BIM B-2242]|uniref:Eco57I restriction-modification methylase domain-containing protein n=1 Tax=Pseudarthrobacter sp. BIM B-2242 TaxID=2772401 RepID=UPI00168BC321|nr:DNA methyltransferase [Pseudarthrobacter sp. BIM B-2242]QOD04370.1 hypothetical protein IDT60_04730 [Pseudarthrobacter sp. BIM B-2242]